MGDYIRKKEKGLNGCTTLEQWLTHYDNHQVYFISSQATGKIQNRVIENGKNQPLKNKKPLIQIRRFYKKSKKENIKNCGGTTKRGRSERDLSYL